MAEEDDVEVETGSVASEAERSTADEDSIMEDVEGSIPPVPAIPKMNGIHNN